MADENKDEAPAGAGAEGGKGGKGAKGAKKKPKKKVVVLAVVALGGAFVAKTMFLKPPPPTPREQWLADKAAALDVWAECAEWNHVAFDADAAEAAYEAEHPPPDEDTAGEDAEDGEGDGGDEPADDGGDEPADDGGDEPADDGGEEHGAGLPGGSLGVRAATARPASAGGVATTGNPVLEVDAITVNLADDHYLKVGLGLELPVGTDTELAEAHGTGAPARDLLISTFTGRPMDELRPPEVREQLRRQIGNELCRASDGQVERVYFTDFVMQ
jgi:flagellar basal body-associated protein FliL